MGDTDIVWTNSPTRKPTTLVAFYQGEQGFASFVAGMGLIGEEKPVAKIYSKLHSVDPMNSFPDPTFPEWRLYEVENGAGRRYFILRLSHTYVVGPNTTKAWLYNYPIFRDITMHLASLGVDELVYMTTHLMQTAPMNDQAYIPDGDVAVFDYLNPENDLLVGSFNNITEMEDEMLVPPPSWMFAKIFADFNQNVLKGVSVVFCPHTDTVFVNERGSEVLLKFMYERHLLSSDTEKINEMLTMINDVEHMQEPAEFTAILDGGFYV